MTSRATVGSSGLVSPRWQDGLRSATMRGIRAWWAVRLDGSEIERRGSAALPCLSRLDLMHVLLNLPLGHLVGKADLRERERKTLDGVSHPVVEWTPAGVVRLVRPSLAVEHAYVAARTFRRGLEGAAQFGTYCTRSMVLPASVSVCDFELAEASYYGVGVYRSGRGEINELVAPEPFPPLAETAASWAFTETLYNKAFVLA